MSRSRYYTLDDRRSLVIPGDQSETLQYALEHWISCAYNAIEEHGAFYVALSGGSTPRTLYQMLCDPQNSSKVDWSRVHLFWSDERSVPSNDPDSNYFMAEQTGLLKLVPQAQIHRMVGEKEVDIQAQLYEETIKKILGGHSFDLIMLGMGEDGHTASLFPQTKALYEKSALIVANHVPQKETWRMTMTFPCINHAHNIALYVLGSSKQETLRDVLFNPLAELPAQKVGTPSHKALWIVDSDAAEKIEELLPTH